MPVLQAGHPAKMDSGQGMQEEQAACSQSLPGTGNKAPYARAAGAKGRAQGKGGREQKGKGSAQGKHQDILLHASPLLLMGMGG